jgi:hypothetical protein
MVGGIKPHGTKIDALWATLRCGGAAINKIIRGEAAQTEVQPKVGTLGRGRLNRCRVFYRPETDL